MLPAPEECTWGALDPRVSFVVVSGDLACTLHTYKIPAMHALVTINLNAVVSVDDIFFEREKREEEGTEKERREKKEKKEERTGGD
jgi:hypothetical protein